MFIPFNKPYLTGKEVHYIYQAVYTNGQIAGNGEFTKKCQRFFEEKYGFLKTLLTTSCTDALEMAALLINVEPGDEIIVPSYTFVTTANAFVLKGAKIVFADSSDKSPNIDVTKIESLITNKTKAIVPMHYAGVAVEMDKIMDLANKYNLFIIEDAAQAIDSDYKSKPLGSIGHLAAFSFHETKNVISGEGGMLVVNDKKLVKRAEIIWEKGTNRAAFFRGEVDKYGWVDVGSSFLPSEVIAAFLYSQLENIDQIQEKRKRIWRYYYDSLKSLEQEGFINLPNNDQYDRNNGHLFYILVKDLKERTKLINYLKNKGIMAVFHYLPLHLSEYYKNKHDGRVLQNAVKYSDTLLRLPFYYEITKNEQDFIIEKIFEYFKK